jgi:hypothetical protein
VIRIFLMGLMLIVLTGCGMMPGNVPNPATPIPTFKPALSTTPAASTPQAALGGKQVGDLFVWLYSSPNLPIRGANTFEAVVTDASGQPVNGAKVSFDIDMTNMSHGKNVVEAKAISDGRYSGKVSFQMPGPWRVIVAVEQAGKAQTVRFDFNVKSK